MKNGLFKNAGMDVLDERQVRLFSLAFALRHTLYIASRSVL
jgi:hypothetical protein